MVRISKLADGARVDILSNGEVRRRMHLLTQRLILGVSHHPDDLNRRAEPFPLGDAERAPDGGRGREILPDEGFVHDGDAGRPGNVVVTNVSAGDEGGAERLEVAVAHLVEPDIPSGARRCRGSFDDDVIVPEAVSDGSQVRCAGGLHAGNGAQPREQLGLDGAEAGWRIVAGAQVRLHQQHAVASEAGIDMGEVAERAEHQAGCGDEHQ